jgi:hypothetical protein
MEFVTNFLVDLHIHEHSLTCLYLILYDAHSFAWFYSVTQCFKILCSESFVMKIISRSEPN